MCPFQGLPSPFPLFPIAEFIQLFGNLVGEGVDSGRVAVDVEDFCEALQGAGTTDGVVLTLPPGSSSPIIGWDII